MLKITVVETATGQRIVLHGKLIGPWIAELRRVWEDLRPQLGSRSAVVDLNEVTLIDDSADGLLATMLEQGAELIANGMVNRWMIQALKEGKTRVSVWALRPNPPRLSHSVDAEHREVTTIAEGAVTLAELRAHLRREQQDSALPYRELIDARSAVVRFSPDEIQEIVQLLRSLSRSRRLGRTAIVVSTEVAYGLMRMLQILVEDVCVVQPFFDVAKATSWLHDGTEG